MNIEKFKKTFIDITLLECVDKTQQVLTLHDAMQFMTGARHNPPNGLQGTICFVHNAGKGEHITANTCALR